MASPEPLSQHLLGGTEKNDEKPLEGYIRSPGRNMNCTPPNSRHWEGIATFYLLLLTLLLLPQLVPPIPLLPKSRQPLLQDHNLKNSFLPIFNQQKDKSIYTQLYAEWHLWRSHSTYYLQLTTNKLQLVFIWCTSLKEPQKMSVSNDLWRRTKWPVSAATHTRRRSCKRRKNTRVSISKSVTNQQTQVQSMEHNSHR